MPKVRFTNAPLLEVAFVVEFEELSNFSSVDFGLYWETIKDNFPDTFDDLPIRKDYDSDLPHLRRVHFISQLENRRIQLQNNILVYNYRNNDQQYPSFDIILQEFFQEWNNFQEWWLNLNAESEEIKVLAYQLLYVNLVNHKSNWFNTKDYHSVFTFIGDPWSKTNKLPEEFNCQLAFTLPDDIGTLDVSLEQKTLIIDEEESSEFPEELNVVLFNLQARSQEEIKYDLETWFKLAHESIVQYFLDLTQDTVHQIWEIEHD